MKILAQYPQILGVAVRAILYQAPRHGPVQYLLLEPAKPDPLLGPLLELPGGKFDPDDEHLIAALKREVREETGLKRFVVTDRTPLLLLEPHDTTPNGYVLKVMWFGRLCKGDKVPEKAKDGVNVAFRALTPEVLPLCRPGVQRWFSVLAAAGRLPGQPYGPQRESFVIPGDGEELMAALRPQLKRFLQEHLPLFVR